MPAGTLVASGPQHADAYCAAGLIAGNVVARQVGHALDSEPHTLFLFSSTGKYLTVA